MNYNNRQKKLIKNLNFIGVGQNSNIYYICDLKLLIPIRGD